MIGITNIKKAVALAVALQKQYKESLTDGFQTMDLFAFIDELSAIPGVVQSASTMKDEINDMDMTERQELHDYIINELEVDAANVEALIADSVDWALATYKLIVSVKGV